MTNNLNESSSAQPNPLMGTPVQTDSVKTDGYNEAVKQGNSMKIVLLVVILLIFGVLVAYILMDYLGGDEEPEVVTPTAVPTIEATIVQEQPTSAPTSEAVTYKDFSFNVFNSDSELIPNETEESAGFAVSGDGYQLNVAALYEAKQVNYVDFVLLYESGDETIARVKDEYYPYSDNQYSYVRTENFDATKACESIGPEDRIEAPCGNSHYVRGNNVQTFYILNITCDADVENVSKCDDIVKTLEVRF